MKPVERYRKCMLGEPVDRLPFIYYGTPEINEKLMKALGVENYEALIEKIGVDFRNVDAVYTGPELKTFPDGSWEGLYGERYNMIPFGEAGSYPEAVYLPYAGMETVEEMAAMCAPSADDFDYSTIARQCQDLDDYALIYGGAGTPDFLNGIGRMRGVQQTYLDVATEHPVFMELCRRRFEFEYEKARRALEAAGGRIDILALGEDLSTQAGPIIAPAVFDKLFRPSYQAFIDLAHRHGARAMLHCCGNSRPWLERLIEMGLDIIETLQTGAANMEIDGLQRDFGGRIIMAGSMCVQSILPIMTPGQVREQVRLRQSLFAGGRFIMGPSHCIQANTPLENVLAFLEEAGQLEGASCH